MLASQRLVILWNLLLQFNLAKGGIPEMNLSVKPFHYSSTSQKVASQSLVLFAKPSTMVVPHKRWYHRDECYCGTIYYGSTSQKMASERLFLLWWNLFLWLNLTKGGIPKIYLNVKHLTMVQPHKRWHPRDYLYCENFYCSSTSQKVVSQRLVLVWNLLL